MSLTTITGCSVPENTSLDDKAKRRREKQMQRQAQTFKDVIADCDAVIRTIEIGFTVVDKRGQEVSTPKLKLTRRYYEDLLEERYGY